MESDLTLYKHLCPGGLYSIQVAGNYAYVTDTCLDSLLVFNISNPSSPIIAGKLVNSTYMRAPHLHYISGNYAYVAGRASDSLAIVKIPEE